MCDGFVTMDGVRINFQGAGDESGCFWMIRNMLVVGWEREIEVLGAQGHGDDVGGVSGT